MIEPLDVTAFLRSRAHDVDPGSVKGVGHGEWSRAFYYRTTTGQDLVVRFSATDQDFRKDQRAMAFASPHLPVPRVLDIGEAFDGYYAISERAFGEFVEERDAAAMTRLLPSLFATLDAMRQVDVSATEGFGLWRGDGSAPHASWHNFLHAIGEDPPSSRIQGWRERLDALPDARDVFARGLTVMAADIEACPNARHLVHSDLLNFNLLVANDHIGSVLDWGSSLYGDFLWDVAWFTLWQPWYADWASVDIRGAARRHFSDTPRFEARMRCYEVAIGLDGMAYEAFTGNMNNLAWTTRRVRGLIGARA